MIGMRSINKSLWRIVNKWYSSLKLLIVLRIYDCLNAIFSQYQPFTHAFVHFACIRVCICVTYVHTYDQLLQQFQLISAFQQCMCVSIDITLSAML